MALHVSAFVGDDAVWSCR